MKTYKELLARTDGPPGSAWGLHGPDDDIGTLNFLSPNALIEAAALVRKGKTFNLDKPLDAFKLPHRNALKHVILGDERHHTRDDYIDGLYLQSGSQVDGLRHWRHPKHGFYNYTKESDIAPGKPRLGVQRYAEHGIAGRGILLDVERYLAQHDKQLDLVAGESFTVDLLEAVAAFQNLSFKPGDILMLRTGWLQSYFGDMPEAHKEQLTKKVTCPGLVQSHRTLEWLWDHQFAVCAADTPGFEAVPPAPNNELQTQLLAQMPDLKPFLASMMHPILIGLLGVCIGELWDMDALAADCAEDGIYEFLLTAKPLNLVGGVGSPANAMAIK